MIHAIRKLAREIHRRSVWQVLAVYLVLAWLSLQGVGFLTERVGLPGWTPTMTFFLFVLGLPVTIATAVVQGGLRWLRIEDVVDPNELEGLTPEQVHVIPQAHPLYGSGVLTWRNAILLGVMSAALLVTSVVAYLTMWTLGIGPVGSLLAQGVIAPADVVVVADFENRTDDMTVAGMVTDAFETDLAESTLVSVLKATDAPSPTGPGSRLSTARARELAEVEEISAVVEGEVSRFGASGYRLYARIVLLPAETPAGQFRETVGDREELIDAVDMLSERVRAKFGESLRVIRAGKRLAELYTPATRP